MTTKVTKKTKAFNEVTIATVRGWTQAQAQLLTGKVKLDPLKFAQKFV